MLNAKIQRVMGMIAADRPRFDASSERVELWSQALGDFPEEELTRGALKCLGAVKGLVTLAHMIEAVRGAGVGSGEEENNPRQHFDGEPRYRDRYGEGGDPHTGMKPAPVFVGHTDRAQWRKANGYYDLATPHGRGQFVRTPTGPILPEPPPEFEFLRRADGAWELHPRAGTAFPMRRTWQRRTSRAEEVNLDT